MIVSTTSLKLQPIILLDVSLRHCQYSEQHTYTYTQVTKTKSANSGHLLLEAKLDIMLDKKLKGCVLFHICVE